MVQLSSRRIQLSMAAFACAVAAACGGAPPTMKGRDGLLSQTAVAQKCEEAARGHDRPFVVEWDATDLASFETKAARDTVVVKYQGCTLDVLYACSDAIAGKFGTYGTPHSTSGTVQGFDIANDGDLYAKLPLGAATLSGRVEAGEQLHLKYFVSGVATSTRDALYGDDLAKIPGCAGATHFVWAYNLGAFSLGTSENNSEHAQAGIGNMGGGGGSSHSAQSVAQGGDLSTCTTNDQRACHVPIRLALRAVTAGSSPANLPVAGGVAPSLDPNAWQGTPAGQARQAIQDANAKKQAGDGAGCLAMLDRAASLDPTQLDTDGLRIVHAECLMMSGNCDGGQKDVRAAFAAMDTNHVKSDAELDREAVDAANNHCPSSTAKADNDFEVRAAHEMSAASKATDADACARLFDAMDKRADAAEKEDRAANAPGSGRLPRSVYSHNSVTSALQAGSFCIAAAKGCAAGYPYYLRAYRANFHGATTYDKSGKESWENLKKVGSLKCQ